MSLLSSAQGYLFSNSPLNSSFFTGSFPSPYRHYFPPLKNPLSYPATIFISFFSRGCLYLPSPLSLFPFSLKSSTIRYLSNPFQLNCPYQGYLNLSVAISNAQVSTFILLINKHNMITLSSLNHFSTWLLEADLPGLPFTPLAALSQYLLLGSIHLSDLKTLEYSKIQSLDLFSFLPSLTNLVPSSIL